eukprot:5747430-Lingulodinium_polyedra.AAC.1
MPWEARSLPQRPVTPRRPRRPAENGLRAGTGGCRARSLTDGGRLYKWIRAGAPPAPGLVPDPAWEPEA